MPLAGNPNIALSVENRSFAQPLIDLAEKQRVDEVTQSNLAGAAQQRVIGEQNIASGARQAEQQTRELNVNEMQAIMLQVGSAKELATQGQLKAAQTEMLNVGERLKAIGQDSSGLEGIVALSQDSPEGFVEFLTEMENSYKPIMAQLMARAGQKPEQEGSKVLGVNQTLVGESSGRVIASNMQEDSDQGYNNQQVQLTFADGTEGSGFINPRTMEAFDSEGKPIEDMSGVRFSTSNITGPKGDVITPSEVSKIMDKKSFTQNLVNNLTDMKEMLIADPDGGTLTAAAASFMGNIRAEGRALARKTGVEFDESFFDTSFTDENTWKNLGIDSSVLKSLATSAAYSLAASQNDGRVSGPDFNAALLQIGGNLADADQRIAVIDSVIDRQTRAFKQTYFDVMEEEFTGRFVAPSQEPAGPAGPATLQDIDNEIAEIQARLNAQ